MEQIITALVEGIVVPVTSVIPFLASSGILLLVFGALWLLFAIEILRDRPSLDAAWKRLRSLPLIVQAVAWLLFLPVLAGLFVWERAWPLAARLLVIGTIAGWNLLVFIPSAP